MTVGSEEGGFGLLLGTTSMPLKVTLTGPLAHPLFSVGDDRDTCAGLNVAKDWNQDRVEIFRTASAFDSVAVDSRKYADQSLARVVC